jgi:hypothetical protein
MHVSELTQLVELTVDRCPKLANLTGLQTCTRLQVLTLRKCRNVRSLSGIETLGLETLRLEQLHNVSDLSAAAGVGKLLCRDLPAVRDATPVVNVPDLRFQKCRNIRTPVDLGALAHVQLEDCGVMRRVSLDDSSETTSLCSDSRDETGSLGGGDNAPSIASTDSRFDSIDTDSEGGPKPLSDDDDRTTPTADNNDQRPTSTIANDGKVRVRADSKDWIAEARDLQEVRGRQQLAEEQALQARKEEIAREQRLKDFERTEAEVHERDLREAEERFAFEETHIRAAERRRANSVQRIEQQAAAEAAARALVEKSATALHDKQRKMATDREQRKARVKAMLKRVKTTDGP